MNLPSVLLTLENYNSVLRFYNIRLTRLHIPSQLFRCSPLYRARRRVLGPPRISSAALSSIRAHVRHCFQCSVDRLYVFGPQCSFLAQHHHDSGGFRRPPQPHLYAFLFCLPLTSSVRRRFPPFSLPWSPSYSSRFLT